MKKLVFAFLLALVVIVSGCSSDAPAPKATDKTTSVPAAEPIKKVEEPQKEQSQQQDKQTTPTKQPKHHVQDLTDSGKPHQFS